jgi:hypothetical protein
MGFCLYAIKKHPIVEKCIGLVYVENFDEYTKQKEQYQTKFMLPNKRGKTKKKDFKIPYGLDADSGQLVKALDAEKLRKYACPSCRTCIILQKGEIRSPHFAHKADVSGCSEETVIHKTAKLLIIGAVLNWKNNGGPRPVIKRVCKIKYCYGSKEQNLPDKIECALEEFQLSSGHIADIALMDEKGVSAIVEVYYTHKVNELKVSEIQEPWLEVDALKIVENPLLWVCRQDSLKPFNCPKCLAKENEKRNIINEVQALAKKNKVTLPPSPPYISSVQDCYRCKQRIIVYTWKGRKRWDKRPPPEPKPKTMQFRYSNTIRDEYWANTCPYCGRIQGDFFLDSKAKFSLFDIPE